MTPPYGFVIAYCNVILIIIIVVIVPSVQGTLCTNCRGQSGERGDGNVKMSTNFAAAAAREKENAAPVNDIDFSNCSNLSRAVRSPSKQQKLFPSIVNNFDHPTFLSRFLSALTAILINSNSDKIASLRDIRIKNYLDGTFLKSLEMDDYYYRYSSKWTKLISFLKKVRQTRPLLFIFVPFTWQI